VAVNTTDDALPVPIGSALRIQTTPRALQAGVLAPHAGAVGVD
jgi:hypothetical protein